jgi:hypothetical protein
MAKIIRFVSETTTQITIEAIKVFLQTIRDLSNKDMLPQEVRLAALRAGIIEQSGDTVRIEEP